MLALSRSVSLIAILVAASRLVAQEVKTPEGERIFGLELYKFDRVLRAEFAKKYPGVLPASKTKGKANDRAFDWTDRHKLNIHSQGDQGTCWAHAAIGALEWSWMLRNGDAPILSVQPILDRTGRTGGGSSSAVYPLLIQYGTALMQDYPYVKEPGPLKKTATPYRAIAWGYVRSGEKPTIEQIKKALIEHGPLSTSVSMSSLKRDKATGLYHAVKEAKATDHAVVLIGWDDGKGAKGAWKIQNSWGVRWGDKGYGWIEYEHGNIGASTRWVIAQSKHYPMPDRANRVSENQDPFQKWATFTKNPFDSDKFVRRYRDKVIDPKDAADYDAMETTVRMEVKSAGKTSQGTLVMRPEKDVATALAIQISADVLAKLKEGGLNESAAYLRGKTIEARGFIFVRELTKTNEHVPFLRVDDAEAFKVVK
jgi:hypothetical protein